uniref:Uncharacterized protein n=1 Tax=Panagrolaimus sp. ES5 TaxID=591445 RepID=A0AC34GAG6_9BILA
MINRWTFILNGTSIKECDGSCFAFKCLNYTTEVTYGAGCYEDFVNACKWVEPKIKEDLKERKNYKYSDETSIIVSCEEGNSSCGILQLNSYEKGREIDENHGYTPKKGKDGCKYDDKPLQHLQKRMCRTLNQCVANFEK